jgi:hypothetical protein
VGGSCNGKFPNAFARNPTSAVPLIPSNFTNPPGSGIVMDGLKTVFILFYRVLLSFTIHSKKRNLSLNLKPNGEKHGTCKHPERDRCNKPARSSPFKKQNNKI